MYLSKTIDSVYGQVETDDAGKWDCLVPCQDLALTQGRLNFPQLQAEGYDWETGLSLSPWATGQACTRLGIPTAYFKKCPSDLQDRQFNHWLQQTRWTSDRADRTREEQENAQSWLLRMKGGTVRGVLSPRYARLDNRDLLKALDPALSNAISSPFRVGLSQITGESFHLRLIDQSLFRDVLPDDRLFAGIHIANSEVGMRAITVEALVFRLVCTNGLIRRIDSKSLLWQRHAFLSPERLSALLSDSIRQAAVVAAGFLERLALAAKTPIPDAEKALAFLAQAWSLSQEMQEWIRFALLREKEPETLYALVNAITSAAQRLPVDRRYEMEVLAGALVETNGLGERLRQQITSSRSVALPQQMLLTADNGLLTAAY